MRFSRLTALAHRLIGGSDQFRRNFLGMASANIIAQAIGVVSLPFLTRLFTPEHFGILSVFVAAHNMLLAVVTARFDWLIPNATRMSQAARLSVLALATIAAVTAATALSLVFARPEIAAAIGVGAAGSGVLWYMPVAVAAGGLQLVLWAWYVQLGDLKPVGISRAAQAVATLVISVAAGAMALGAAGLVLGYVLGFLVSLPLLAAGRGRQVQAMRMVRAADVGREFRTQWRAAAVASAVSVINTAMTLSTPFLLAQAYNVVVVGWYGLVLRIATAPVGLITNALNHSFWSDAARLARENPRELRAFYLGSVRRLSVIGLLVVLVALAGPWYIGPIFGRAEWSEAGVLLAAVSPYLFAITVFSPTSHLMVYGCQSWQLWCDLVALVLSALAILVAGRLGLPPWVAIAASSGFLLAGYLVRFWLHLVAINRLIARMAAAPVVGPAPD